MGVRRRVVVAVAATIMLAVPLVGCTDGGRRDSWPVGTCVRVSDEGATTAVPCAEPHTHRVIAIVAGEGEACPEDTAMYSRPADPDEGLVTTCFRAEAE